MPEIQLSEREEMYLVTIARIQEAGDAGPVPLKTLARELGIGSISTNQMVRTLEEAGWLIYTPYKGVEFTPPGRQRALRILRHRRLWQVFLVERIGYSSDEASELACRLEHTLPS